MLIAVINNRFRRMAPQTLETALQRFSSAADDFIETIAETTVRSYAESYRDWLVGKVYGNPGRPPVRLGSTPAASLVRFHLNQLFQTHFKPATDR
jgi:hypothetical protein